MMATKMTNASVYHLEIDKDSSLRHATTKVPM